MTVSRRPANSPRRAQIVEAARAVISDGLAEWADLAERAPRERSASLASIGNTYRSFARAHPHLYRVMTDGPLPRAALTPGTEERAARPLVDVAGGDTDLARAVWAFAHGMVILELDGRFPTNADLEAAWRRGLAGLGAARA